jgi:distribution and morphology protein 10
LVAAISDPYSTVPGEMRGRGGDVSNVMVNLQHDVGKWSTEYTWSAEDSMWGVRVLHNFGRLGTSADLSEDNEKSASPTSGSLVGIKRVDEEDAVEGGLKGRVSVGAELYFSAKERSAGGQFPCSKFDVSALNCFFSIDWYSVYDSS